MILVLKSPYKIKFSSNMYLIQNLQEVFALVNTGVKPPFCKISWLKLQKLLNLRWPSETES